MKCAYLIVLMATYWMTEAMPLPITSMIPMVTKIAFMCVFYFYLREGTPKKKRFFLGKSPKLWVGGGQES